MDTTKWGPSGWKLLHLISFQYPNKPSNQQKKNIIELFELLGDLLPCKYCRISIKKFYKEIPIDEYLDNKNKLIEFVYLIHNKVNDKLKKQGLLLYDNPQLSDVKIYYNKINKQKIVCNNRDLQGWDFIYSIIINNSSIININSKRKELLYLLSKIYPCHKIRKIINKTLNNNKTLFFDKDYMMKLIFIIECKFNGNDKITMDELSRKYNLTCHKYNSFKVNCIDNSNSKIKSCRK